MTEASTEAISKNDSRNGLARWQRDGLVALALAVITFLIFIQARQFDFIDFDDPLYVTRNDRVLNGLSWANVRWAFTTFKTGNWHPITWLSHMLDAQLFGPGPAGPHVTNVVIHCVNVAMVYLVLAMMTCRPWRSAIVAAFFGLHPLRIESVAWISERKDVLCAFFFLLTIGCFARYVRSRSRGWYLASLLAFALSLMSKSMSVTLPCVLLLLDAWPLDRWRRKRAVWLIIESLPFFTLSIACAVVTYVAQKEGGAMAAVSLPLTIRAGNAVLSVGRYLFHTVRPSGLAAFYPYLGLIPGTHLPWGHVLISAVVMLLITGMALIAWRRERALMIGWLWFLGMLVPTIGLVQVGTQSMADRYTYLPHIGLWIAIVWGAGLVVENYSHLRRVAAVLAGGIAIVLAISTAYQLNYWRNGYRLFRNALESTTHNYVAASNIASFLREHGHADEAMAYYEAAVKIAPGMADLHNNLGSALLERGDVSAAIKELKESVGLNPNYAEGRNNYGNALAAAGETKEAIAQYRQAIRIDSSMTEAHFNLGLTLASAGQTSVAIEELQRAIELRPIYLQARYALALALAQSGQAAAAETQMKWVLDAKPDWAEAMGRFAWALSTQPDARGRDAEFAVQLADRANVLTMGQQPHLLDALAASLAAAGRFEEATNVVSHAIAIASRDPGAAALVNELELRRNGYRHGHPFIISTTAPATRPAATTRAIH